MKKVLLLYIPAIHQGCLNLMNRHRQKRDVDGLLVVGQSLIDEFFDLHKEIRAIDPLAAASVVEVLMAFKRVEILDVDTIANFSPEEIITTSEVINEKIIAKYFPSAKVTLDSAFLFWDENSIQAPTNVRYDRISTDAFDREMMCLAKIEGDRSSDWWRHVGSVLVKEGMPLFETHNTHLPSEYTQYMEGDPRDFVKSGSSPDICSAIHAEKLMIATAARKGISTEGCDIYLTTFPCIPCAQIIACSGIKRVFYSTGNAYLNTDEVLKSKGVEIILVQ